LELLNYLLKCSAYQLWAILLFENAGITILTLVAGRVILKIYNQPQQPITYKQWQVCSITNILNTVVTYVGFWLWANHYINVETSFSGNVVTDSVILFFAMDILMYLFHYLIHHSLLYKSVHYFHHLSVNPTPIDLFILHPIETITFGGLWLGVLLCYTFNLYAIAIYLAINVFFGMIGHLGIDQSPARSAKSLFKYLGTSVFHHDHHQYPDHNYGFYTSIWDRLLGTYKKE